MEANFNLDSETLYRRAMINHARMEEGDLESRSPQSGQNLPYPILVVRRCGSMQQAALAQPNWEWN